MRVCYQLVVPELGVSADLIEFGAQRMLNDDGPAIGDRLDRVAHIARHHRNQAGSGDLGCVI